LQNNARWWHVLHSRGVKIDARAFQSSDSHQREACIRAMVPQLLERNDLNIDMAIEYCRQFDIEPEFASICLLEMVLTQPRVLLLVKAPHTGDDSHLLVILESFPLQELTKES